MKKTATLKIALAALMLTGGAGASFAYNNVWVKADAYPTGAGKVYLSCWNPVQEEDPNFDFQPSAEFKRSIDVGASTAFILGQPAEGYLFAGIARDNGNGVYDNGVDEQVRRREEDGFFTAVYDPEEYNVNGSSSMSKAAAEEALEQMEQPTDHIFAVFTKGDVARVTPEQSTFTTNIYLGTVVSSKLDNAPGEEVTFTALPDAHFHFIGWTDEAGTEVSTENPLTVKAVGGKVYLACFAEGDDPQGISDVKEERLKMKDGVFDLQGRAVILPRKGLYVTNGRKKLVK